MLASGTGLAPMLPILQSITDNEEDETFVTLVGCFCTFEKIYLKPLLQDLARYWNIRIFYVLSQVNKWISSTFVWLFCCAGWTFSVSLVLILSQPSRLLLIHLLLFLDLLNIPRAACSLKDFREAALSACPSSTPLALLLSGRTHWFIFTVDHFPLHFRQLLLYLNIYAKKDLL